MKLQRFSLVDTEDWIFDGEDEYPVTTQAIGPVDDGEYYLATDVHTLLASIRAAVDAEREADPAVHHRCDCPFGWCDGSCPTLKARKALDALLAGEG